MTAADPTPADQVVAVRRGVGCFRLSDRGLIGVSGGDRTRWLNGMVTNDVAALAPGPERSGCYAARLTHRGLILADFHVLLRGDAFWLETLGSRVGGIIEELDRFVIADDVTLTDLSARFDRIGLEGPAVPGLLAAACAAPPTLADEACTDVRLPVPSGEIEAVAAAFGWSGEPAIQLFGPAGSGDAVAAWLADVARDAGLPWVDAEPEALEILRIEAGVPLLGADLDDDVFPDEARLGRAISTTKGCYTGQEIVARIRSRGQVNHLLVGLQFDGEGATAGERLQQADREVGEITSSCVSPSAGAIGLGYVRRSAAEPGTELVADNVTARVLELPIVPSSTASGAPAAR